MVSPDCRFRDLTDAHVDGAVVRVKLSDGCLCYPNDREQDLCAHHFRRSTPLGSMDVIRWYDQDVKAFWEKRGEA